MSADDVVRTAAQIYKLLSTLWASPSFCDEVFHLTCEDEWGPVSAKTQTKIIALHKINLITSMHGNTQNAQLQAAYYDHYNVRFCFIKYCKEQ